MSDKTNIERSKTSGFCLYEDQSIDFDEVRIALVRLFGVDHSVTIHDGDACTLFERVAGHYCAGTIRNPKGETVATFAIDYVIEHGADGPSRRQVVGLHIGPRGHWCRSLADLDSYNEWLAQLAWRLANGPHEQE